MQIVDALRKGRDSGAGTSSLGSATVRKKAAPAPPAGSFSMPSIKRKAPSAKPSSGDDGDVVSESTFSACPVYRCRSNVINI